MAEFLVTVAGKKLVYLGDDHEDTLTSHVADEYDGLENIAVEDGVETEVDFTATFIARFEANDLEELIREEYADVLGDLSIESIDEV